MMSRVQSVRRDFASPLSYGRGKQVSDYRKKPIIIQAVQLPISSAPSWLADAIDAGTVRLYANGTAEIDTLEGTMRGDFNDWIIRGVKGEIYPCKADIFIATYDAV